jgi:hypothetical protein
MQYRRRWEGYDDSNENYSKRRRFDTAPMSVPDNFPSNIRGEARFIESISRPGSSTVFSINNNINIYLYIQGFRMESDRKSNEHVISQRMKQINHGKNNLSHDNYIREIPRF